jgi:methionyl-tRNA synthetase
VFWPTMLKAAGIPLYAHLNVHGYWLADERKMSKSLGNVVSPLDLHEKYGNDAFRYFLMRDMSFGLDASFHEAGIAERINSDLANDLGNLLHRTLGMLGRYTDGAVPPFGPLEPADEALRDAFLALPDAVTEHFEALHFDRGLELVMAAVRKANKYVADQEPWTLAKDPAHAARLGTVLRSVVEALRVASVLLEPVLTTKARALRAQLGLDDAPATLDDARRWDGAPTGTATRPGEPLFPRIDLEALAEAIAAPTEPPLEHKSEVTIDDFAKLEFRVGLVQHAEPHPKADKLLVLTVKVGPETRTIVSGIKAHYTPEALIGKKVVIVANLKPVKLRGVESQGMVLAAEGADGALALATLDRDLADGSEVR